MNGSAFISIMLSGYTTGSIKKLSYLLKTKIPTMNLKNYDNKYFN